MADIKTAILNMGKLVPAVTKAGKLADAMGAVFTIAPVFMDGPITVQTFVDLHQSGDMPGFGDAAHTLWQIGCTLLDDPTQAATVVAVISAVLQPATK